MDAFSSIWFSSPHGNVCLIPNPMRRPIIVHVVENIAGSHGGSTSAAFAIAHETAPNLRCVLLGMDYGGRVTSDINENTELVRVACGSGFWGKGVGLIKGLLWLCRNRAQISIVEFHNVFTPLFLIGAPLMTISGVQFILNPHNSLDVNDLNKKKLLKKLIGYLYLGHLLSQCVAVRCATRREWSRLVTYGRPVSKTWALLPIRLNVDYQSDTSPRGEMLNILFCSRLDRKKQVEVLLYAAAKLRERGVKFILTIAGTGDPDYELELRELAAVLNLISCVVWAGFVAGDDKSRLFKMADLFVLPSRYENFGIVVVEALCYGLRPVLTPNVFVADHLPSACRAVFITGVDDLIDVFHDAASSPEKYRLSPQAARLMNSFLLGPNGAGHINSIYWSCLNSLNTPIL